MRLKWKLTVACLKMFFRQREAVFWTIFLPLFMITLFGFVRFDKLGTIQLGIVNRAGLKGISLIQSFKHVKTFEVSEGDKTSELKALSKGERDLVLVIPAEYQDGDVSSITAYLNDAKPQEAQLGSLVLQEIIDGKSSSYPKRLMLHTESVRSRKLTYMDFLVPGVLAMSIMQMGIFSVAFVFVDLKKRGILRRLKVTPINPNDFILAQVITRLVVLTLQIGVMVGVGVVFFHLNFIGNFFYMFVIGLLGAIVFLGIGFALAGIAKAADQVAPLANVITLPMLLLSGVFFSRSNLPGFAHVITSCFPLTFLADGMRSIAIDGATLQQVAPQMIGLLVWCIVTTFAAVKMFRWE